MKNMNNNNTILVVVLSILFFVGFSHGIPVDGSKFGRTFDGIGGLSGGGATSRLLYDYPADIQSQILDYLFLPNFGASLHILKVEIGGDAQTTDGTESSHMHTRDDLNYYRGYEWWLLVEAKKRNPDILVYGLAWAVPGWIGNGNFFSQDNIDYHVKWIQGAKSVYNVTVDYIGIWNERTCTTEYIINLRAGLDIAGFQHTQIVACDGDWGIAGMIQSNSTLQKVVSILGVHYPGTNSPSNAQALGLPLWASEDYSTYSDSVGGGCWARILNQNYVNGYMTSTISWNLIAAYYPGLPYYGDGLMWSVSPWSGNYDVKSPIWISAHTTQFTKPGWKYLTHNGGVGALPNGGDYVTLVPSTNPNGDFTLVIETLTHDMSICIRPGLPPFTVTQQNVTFTISGGLNTRGPYHVWYSHLYQNESQNVLFTQLKDITPVDGNFSILLETDSVYTITTTTGQSKGSFATPIPPATPFPLPYKDNFDGYQVEEEARYFADQTGTFAIYKTNSSQFVLRQVVTQYPIVWCGESQSPITLIGDIYWTNIVAQVDFLIEKTGYAVLGGRAAESGCDNNYSNGFFLTVYVNGTWHFNAGTSTRLASGSGLTIKAGEWHTLTLSLGTTLTAEFDAKNLFSLQNTDYTRGFVALGTSWDYVQFDNFAISGAA